MVNIRIILNQEEINKCIEFSKKCANNQQEIEFGESTTIHRNVKEISRDNLIGKMAEVAFQKFIKSKFNIDTEVDFNYYPRGVWDDADISINGWRFDIKSSRVGASWLLVEQNKINFRKKYNNNSHIFVMSVTGWDRKNDTNLNYVDIVGYISYKKLINSTMIHKGEFLPNKNIKLQSDNYCVKFNNLNKDWDLLINTIINNPTNKYKWD